MMPTYGTKEQLLRKLRITFIYRQATVVIAVYIAHCNENKTGVVMKDQYYYASFANMSIKAQYICLYVCPRSPY
jgi:hypothetical protein